MGIVAPPLSARAVANALLPPLSGYNSKNPLYLPHRGGAWLYPENSAEAFRSIISDGCRSIELDVQALSDGTLGVIHDSTVDAVTTGTGNVNTFSSTTFQALTMDTDVWLSGGFGNLNPPMLRAVLREFRGKVIFAPEVKDQLLTTAQAMLQMFKQEGIPPGQALVQCFSLPPLAPMVSAGYDTLLLSDGSHDIPSVLAAGVNWVGVDGTVATDTQIQNNLAAGLKVLVWTIDRRRDRDRFLALGVHGFFTNDPLYLGAQTPYATRDAFGRQGWMPGMLPAVDFSAGSRGRFTSPDYWGAPASNFGIYFNLMGWMCPIKGDPAANNFTLDFKITFDSANGDDSRWASVFIASAASKDMLFSDSAGTEPSGYHFLLRKDGRVQIYRRDGSSANVLQTVTGAVIALGAEVSYRIIVTPTQVTAQRINVDGSVAVTTTATDSTYRGGYVHFGRNGLQCRFRQVRVS